MAKTVTLKTLTNNYTVGTPEGTLVFCAATPKYEVSDEIADHLAKQIDYRNDAMFIVEDAPVIPVVKKMVKKAVDTTQPDVSIKE